MSYLGLDVGTSGCKAVAFDDSGRQIARAYREYSLITPQDGWAELDAAGVVDSCMEVIREAASACTGDPVRGMCISSQGEAFAPMDSAGRVIGNAMVSSDARANSIVEPWSREFGEKRLYEKTGHSPYSIYSLYKLLWLRDNDPEVWRTASKFYCFEELVQARLGLRPAISWPLAGRTMLFNVRTHQWDEDILSSLDLDSSRLARTLPAGAVVGTIPDSVAAELGLPKGVIVVAGGHDQTCGALGAGIASADRAVYGMGTVECITPAFETPVFSEELFRNNLATYDYTAGGMYTTVAFSVTGGNLLQWIRRELAHVEAEQAKVSGRSAYELILESLSDKPSDLMVLPYFTPSGTPYFDTEVKGCILGLRLTTTRAEIIQALLEGVTYEMRLNVDILSRSGIGISELVAIGGGAQSDRLLKLKADVFGRPIARAEVTEAGCMGAAMLAKSAHTGQDVRDIAREWVHVTDVFEPEPRNAQSYKERFEQYLGLYPRTETVLYIVDRRPKCQQASPDSPCSLATEASFPPP